MGGSRGFRDPVRRVDPGGRIVGSVLAVWTATACAARPDAGAEPAPDAVLPELRVEQVVTPSGARGHAPHADRLFGLPVFAPRGDAAVDVAAVGADVRSLLLALARQAGVDLVIAPEVRGTVSVSLEDVPALDALEAVLLAAGLGIVSPPAAPWGATVFYVLPVDIDEADAALIQERFGVSAEMARWIIRNRSRRSPGGA